MDCRSSGGCRGSGRLGAIGGAIQHWHPQGQRREYETAISLISSSFWPRNGGRGGQGERHYADDSPGGSCTSHRRWWETRRGRCEINAPVRYKMPKRQDNVEKCHPFKGFLRSEPGMGRLEHWISSILTMRAGPSATSWSIRGLAVRSACAGLAHCLRQAELGIKATRCGADEKADREQSADRHTQARLTAARGLVHGVLRLPLLLGGPYLWGVRPTGRLGLFERMLYTSGRRCKPGREKSRPIHICAAPMK